MFEEIKKQVKQKDKEQIAIEKAQKEKREAESKSNQLVAELKKQ